jgi:dephospho-CoA kinase
MQIIGVTGGVASGKSLVTGQIAALGAGELDADHAGHEALRVPPVVAAARRRWGDAIFGPDGQIDRAKLAQIVFGREPEADRERKYLEQLSHPEISGLLKRQAEVYEAAGVKIAVLDAALLFEAGWDRVCEKTIFVDSPREQRLVRALARGWTEEDFAAREGVQDSSDRKRARADVIIDNSGSAERTQAQIERFWASLVR